MSHAGFHDNLHVHMLLDMTMAFLKEKRVETTTLTSRDIPSSSFLSLGNSQKSQDARFVEWVAIIVYGTPIDKFAMAIMNK